MKFSIKDFFSKFDKIRRKKEDLVTFTEDILNGKLHFLCIEYSGPGSSRGVFRALWNNYYNAFFLQK